MNIIAVDDEFPCLNSLERVIKNALPSCKLTCFNSTSEALSFAQRNKIDLAFLDIKMEDMNGLELAKRIKDLQGNTNIVFVTGDSQYALDSYVVPASGYIMKPASETDIVSVMEHLRNPIVPSTKKLRVQCFGNFDVFLEGMPLHFPRSKSKELFAYLIHRKGTSCSTRELAAVLFEDKEDSKSLQKQMQTIISTMMKVLGDEDLKDVIIKKFNSISINMDKVDCDYYRYLQCDVNAVNEYTGEYMSNYSWAEFTIGYLDRINFDSF